MTHEDVISWLLTEGPRMPLQDVIRQLPPLMEAAGLPLVRLWHNSFMLHPLLELENYLYVDGELTYTRAPHGWLAQVTRDERGDSPPGRLTVRGEPEYVADLTEDTLEYPILEKIRDLGGTYYAIWPTRPRDRRIALADSLGMAPEAQVEAITAWVTGTPKVLDASQRDALHRIHQAFEVISLLHVETTLSQSVTEAYLGKGAAERVLNGAIRRGDVETIRAAIVFTDLRGFTAMSERSTPEEMMSWLNDAFDAQVNALEAHGGEVLAFNGDGLLAIFRQGDEGAVCDSALAAAREVATRTEAANAERAARDAAPIHYGLALHHGDVRYGNFGAAHRLDFTVNGPAVNQAARIESLCPRVGVVPLLSAAFAERVSVPVHKVGSFDVKGVPGLEVWALNEESE